MEQIYQHTCKFDKAEAVSKRQHFKQETSALAKPCLFARVCSISFCFRPTNQPTYRPTDQWTRRAKGDVRAIGRTLTLASVLSVTLGIFMAFFFYQKSAGLLFLMGAPPEVMDLAVPYLRWRASAFPANLWLLVASGAFRYATFNTSVFAV